MDSRKVVSSSVSWFKSSGVMRPSDGFWGVGERVLLTSGNKALERTFKSFPCHSVLAPGIVALEHRRSDCNFQTALLFNLASEFLGDDSLKALSASIRDFLFNRASLLDTMDGSPAFGLWQFFQQQKIPSYYTDDNSWCIAIMLALAKRGLPELRAHAINAARTLNVRLTRYFDALERSSAEAKAMEGVDGVCGLRLNPHWCGLGAMALALASLEDRETSYSGSIDRYFAKWALSGPVDDELSSKSASHGGLPWSLSEYAYLAMAAPVVAAATGLDSAKHVARKAADILLSRQLPDGHFPAEHYEAPASPNLADMIYTQNFASIGLLHCARLLGDGKCEDACARSLEFLAKIQDRSESPCLRGCWRGMYDVEKDSWGGGDEYEGGQSSVYSGWTNAPIAMAFIFHETGTLPFMP